MEIMLNKFQMDYLGKNFFLGRSFKRGAKFVGAYLNDIQWLFFMCMIKMYYVNVDLADD